MWAAILERSALLSEFELSDGDDATTGDDKLGSILGESPSSTARAGAAPGSTSRPKAPLNLFGQLGTLLVPTTFYTKAYTPKLHNTVVRAGVEKSTSLFLGLPDQRATRASPDRARHPSHFYAS